MKYCPTCQKEFDEDIIRFCTKDGTPLVKDKKPTFTDNLPSETSQDEDDGAATIIRRKPPKTNVTAKSTEKTTVGVNENTSSGISPETEDSKRIVISTSGESQKNQKISQKNKVVSGRTPTQPQKKSNTALIVVTTMFGTIALLAGALGVWYFLSSESNVDANANVNINENIDINAGLNQDIGNIDLDNINIDFNSNVNNSNLDLNLNLNTNLKTPTPTKTPKPTKTPTPTPNTNSNVNTIVNSNVNVTTPTKTPTPVKTPTKTPTPVKTPTKTPTPVKTPTPNTNTNKPVNVGTLNGRALRLPTPAYPASARQAKAKGRVTVTVTVDKRGNVVSAKATSGHPLLRNSAEIAAKRSKFRPVTVGGNSRRAVGTVVYNFVQ